MSVFVEASDARRAMISYERALQWQELFELCVKEQLDGDEITDIAYRIAGTPTDSPIIVFQTDLKE
jgi:elongator complex protein 1